MVSVLEFTSKLYLVSRNAVPFVNRQNSQGHLLNCTDFESLSDVLKFSLKKFKKK